MFSGGYDHTVNAMAFKFREKVSSHEHVGSKIFNLKKECLFLEISPSQCFNSVFVSMYIFIVATPLNL